MFDDTISSECIAWNGRKVVPCFKVLTEHLPAQSPQKASDRVVGVPRWIQ